MNSIISLNDGWLCAYYESEPDVYEFASDESITTLSAWTFDKRRSEGWWAWLQRRFFLEPTDFCVRYFLLIDSAPQAARIFVNGEYVTDYHVGDDDPPLELDVTDYVSLEENTLAFRVNGDAVGQFAGVRLQAASCDDLPD